MSMKESLRRVQKDLESAQAELNKLYDLVESLEKTVGGGVKAEKPAKATPAPKKAARAKTKTALTGTATDRVLALIKKNPEGISSDAIIKQTGLQKKTVYGIVTKAKKEKKVKSPKRGIYITA